MSCVQLLVKLSAFSRYKGVPKFTFKVQIAHCMSGVLLQHV